MGVSLRLLSQAESGRDKRTDLVCFAHAGAGSTQFALWPRQLPDGLILSAHVPPGREERAKDPMRVTVEELVAEVLPEIAVLAGPVVLVGHSFGAMLAYELAHVLVSVGRPPARLVVLAAAPPGRIPAPRLTGDDDLAALWVRLGADPAPLARPSFRKLVFPPLRADLTAHIAYRPPEREPLTLPLTVVIGESDPTVTREDALAWQPLATGGCDIVTVPGGHFFPRESVEATVSAVTDALSR
ncbi:thioesterase II family protein [Amycolatopsis sp. lyj-346]|uniref:thioesterase II family protein n=1 Tax=Amycolatopsis sp. lyj-346 TaxID=2789289 RepID=UPI0039794C86